MGIPQIEQSGRNCSACTHRLSSPSDVNEMILKLIKPKPLEKFRNCKNADRVFANAFALSSP